MKTKLKINPISVGSISNRPLYKELTQEKGITLVALIITIIVLIILAAVAILAFTESGLLKTASKGTENYANAQKYEQEIMQNLSDFSDKVVANITGVSSGGTDLENPPTPPTTEGPEMPEKWDETKVYAYKSKDNIIVPVPKGFTVSEVVEEQSVNTGLVIKIVQDNVTSEFVWVPVANTSEMFGANGGRLYDFGTSSSPKNPPTEIEYSSKGYREPDIITSYDGADSANSSYFKEAISSDMTGEQFKAQLQEEFNAMKTSVEKYNGFYIGRYETGNLSQEKAVVSKGNTDIANQNWYVQYQKNKGIVEGKSSMIWGCQWDAVLKWFLSSTDDSVRTYVTNSTGKGNYDNPQRWRTCIDTYRFK